MLTKLHSSLIKDSINNSKNYIEWFNNMGEIQLLLHQISLEKSHFLPIINPHDLARVYIVNVKQDNQRIRNQMGAFVLFGLGISCENDSLMWKSHTNLTHPGKYFRPSKVKIMRPTSPK